MWGSLKRREGSFASNLRFMPVTSVLSFEMSVCSHIPMTPERGAETGDAWFVPFLMPKMLVTA